MTAPQLVRVACAIAITLAPAAAFANPGDGSYELTAQISKTAFKVTGKKWYAKTLQFSADGGILIASGANSEDNVFRFWDVASGKLVAEIPEMQNDSKLAVTPDGQFLVLRSPTTLVLARAATGKIIQRVVIDPKAWSLSTTRLALTKDGGTVATQHGAKVRSWDVASGKERKPLAAASGKKDSEVTALAFTPDGGTLIGGINDDDRLHFWDMRTRKLRLAAPEPCALHVTQMAVSADGARLITVNLKGLLCAWDPRTLAMEGVLTRDVRVERPLLMSPDGNTLLYFDANHAFTLWDIEKERKKASFATSYGTNFAVSSDWKTAAVIGPIGDKSVRVFDVASGALRGVFSSEPETIDFTLDGKTLITGGYTSNLWEVSTGRRREFSSGNSYYSLAIAPDGKSFAACELYGTAHFYGITAAPTPQVPAPTAPALLSAEHAFSEPSGDGVLAAGESGTLRVTLRNTGRGAAHAVRVIPRLEPFAPGIQLSPEIVLQTLPPAATAALDIVVRATPELASGEAKIVVSVTEGNGFDAPPFAAAVKTRGFAPPRLGIAGVSLAGGGSVKKLATNRVAVTIRNSGEGPAQGVRAALAVADPNIFLESKEPVALGDLEPGGSKEAEFGFFINNRYSGAKELPITVGIEEAAGKYGVKPVSLRLALDEPAPDWSRAAAASGAEFKLKRMTLLRGDDELRYPVSSRDGKWAAAGSGGGSILVWDTATGERRAALKIKLGKHSELKPQAFTPDGDGLYAIADNNVYLLDLVNERSRPFWSGTRTRYETRETGSAFQPIATFSYNLLEAAALSPDGRMLALGGCYEKDEESILLDVETKAERVLPSGSGCVRHAVFSPKGRHLALGRESGGMVEVWDPAAAKRVSSWTTGKDAARALAFSPDGQTLATSFGEKDIALWDPATGARKGVLKGDGYAIGHLAYSPDGSWLVSTSYNNMTIWDAPASAPKEKLSTGYYRAFTFLPDGTLAAANAKSLILYSLYGGKKAAPKPKAPARLELDVSFREPSGNRALDAGEEGELVVKIANRGKGSAYAVRLLAALEKPAPGLRLPQPLLAGEIAPGKSVTQTLTLRATAGIGAQTVTLKIEAREGNGFDAAPQVIEFQSRALEAPRLEIAGLSLAGQGVVKVNMVNKLTVKVRNSGRGAARDVKAELALGSPEIFPSGETAYALGTLAPGQTAKADFEFFVNARFKGKKLPLALSLSESFGRFGVREQPLHLALDEAPSAALIQVQEREREGAPAAPATADVDAPPHTETARDPAAYAVVVGVEKYRESGLPAVDYAARDAQAVHAYLTQSMGFDSRNVILLQNESAAKTDLEKYLGAWLNNRVTKKSRVFVYFAGHGAPDPATGEGYLIPYDGDPSYTKETAYPLKKLYASLASLPAEEVTVVLDSCFSGRGKRSVIAKGARPLVLTKSEKTAGENTVVLSAAGADQISTFQQDAEHGLLTYYLLRGLRGDADADGNGRITTGELFAYTQPAVEREARLQNVSQTPTLDPALDALGRRANHVWIRLK
ncbi:MAG: caspase family protein [Elusimicrobiota bacterium]